MSMTGATQHHGEGRQNGSIIYGVGCLLGCSGQSGFTRVLLLPFPLPHPVVLCQVQRCRQPGLIQETCPENFRRGP